jgi:hypothetical protein
MNRCFDSFGGGWNLLDPTASKYLPTTPKTHTHKSNQENLGTLRRTQAAIDMLNETYKHAIKYPLILNGFLCFIWF